MQIKFSANFPIHCQTWKHCIHPAPQVMYLTPCSGPPALFLVTSYMAWDRCPQMVVALKYKWAAEKPVGNYGNPTSLLLLGIQLLRFLAGNLQWVSAQDRAVSVCPNQDEPKYHI